MKDEEKEKYDRKIGSLEDRICSLEEKCTAISLFSVVIAVIFLIMIIIS